MNDELHTLYRFFNSESELLYIGITCQPGLRFKQHRRDKSWWHEVARIELEQFASRAELVEAEQRAVPAENPKYNIQLREPRVNHRPGFTKLESKRLVGMYFHSDEDRQWQGRVKGTLGGPQNLILVQLYEWLTGSPSVTKLVPADEMYEWTFYDDPEEWRNDYEYRIAPQRERTGG